VSVSLSKLRPQAVEEMDFGDTKIPHTWQNGCPPAEELAVPFRPTGCQKMPVFLVQRRMRLRA